MKQTTQPTEGQLVYLDPKVIQADSKDNMRFGLKPAKVKSMAQSILAEGTVISPIEVSPLNPPVNGHTYRLNAGNYRLAGVIQLNAEGAGMTIPAIVHTVEAGLKAAKRNLTENVEREELSLMDQARAAQFLLDQGEEKIKVREQFARPGRKGPVSYSWLNTVLGFLDLPKAIQNKIHNGEVSFDAARTMVNIGKEDKDGLAKVLAQVEDDRNRAIAKEEKEEEKFLATLRKASEAEEKAKEAEKKLADIKAAREKKVQDAADAVTKTQEYNANLLAEKEKALTDATALVSTDAEAGAKAVALAVKELGATKKVIEATEKKAAEALQRITDKYAAEDKEAEDKLKGQAAEARETVKAGEDAKAERQPGGSAKKKTADKAVTGKDVSKAAAKAGVAAGSGVVPLNKKEIMDIVREMCLPGGEGIAEKRARNIAQGMLNCFNGHGTKDTLYKVILDNCKPAK